MVDVVYDASNMFGAIVRYTTTCRFESWTDDTKPRLYGYDADGRHADPERLAVLNRMIEMVF